MSLVVGGVSVVVVLCGCACCRWVVGCVVVVGLVLVLGGVWGLEVGWLEVGWGGCILVDEGGFVLL